MNTRLRALLVALYLPLGGCVCITSGGGDAPASLKSIKLPEGFVISMYAPEVPGARSLALGERGIVYVGTRSEGKVYALVDADGDMIAERVALIASNLNSPNGVTFRNGALYVAEVHRVIRYDGITDRIANPPAPVVINDGFPRDRHHGWKFIAFGPDGMLYVPVGAPCNNCLSAEARYASIMRMKADGSGLSVYAHGVRNTVGFDWHPATKELWFTENGRDWMGNDLPPDELNHAPRAGMHFGYPFCHGRGIVDPEFGKGKDCAVYTPPARGA